MRSQYEKEGEYASLQTKFNFAWVSKPHIPHHLRIPVYFYLCPTSLHSEMPLSPSSQPTSLPTLIYSSPPNKPPTEPLPPSKGLIKSTQRTEQQEGVRLLTDIFRASPDRRRECLYYLALGNYKLGNYAEARRYNELLLDLEVNNLQAQSLRGLIDDKVAKEGLVGVAIVGGLAVAAGVVGSLLFRGAQRKR